MLGSITSVQIGAAWATTIFHDVGPSGTCLLRLASASVVLSVLFRPRLGGLSRRQWLLAAALGLVLAAMNLSFYHAISRIPLGTAVTIEFIGPLAVAIAGSRRRRDLLWAALAAAGILALSNGITHGADATGFILAGVAGVMWGTYILVQARLGEAFDDNSGLAVAMTIGTVTLLPVGVAQGGGTLLDLGVLGVGVAVGILSSAIPYTLELEALRRLSTGTFGVLMSLEPAVAALAGAVVLAQTITLRDALGICLVVAASLGTSLTTNPLPELTG